MNEEDEWVDEIESDEPTNGRSPGSQLSVLCCVECDKDKEVRSSGLTSHKEPREVVAVSVLDN